MKRARWAAGMALLVGTLLLAGGCSSVGYYAQSVGGHLELMRRAKPVPDWLADPATPEVLRQRLQKLADRISAAAPHGYRVFTDSAPVMEVALAEKAGLGWRGKHSLLLSREAGSFFFLGEIYTDLELPVDAPRSGHCGSCRACIDACPTGAIVAPYRVDARRCISYLTIERRGAIDEWLQAKMGEWIFGVVMDAFWLHVGDPAAREAAEAYLQ